jgi:hypothetical protein
MDLGIIIAIVMLIVWAIGALVMQGPGWIHLLLTVGRVAPDLPDRRQHERRIEAGPRRAEPIGITPRRARAREPPAACNAQTT